MLRSATKRMACRIESWNDTASTQEEPMNSRMVHGVVLTIAIGLSAGLWAQRAPKVPTPSGPDIIVNGGTPRMIAGLWTFQSGMRVTEAQPGQRMASPPRLGTTWTRCIGDGDTAAIVDQLIGAEAMFDGAQSCSRFGLSITSNRVSGSRHCSLMGTWGLISDDTRLNARIAETTLAARYRQKASFQGETLSSARWAVEGRRVGDCPGATLAAPASQQDGIPTGPLPSEPDHPPAAQFSTIEPAKAPPPAPSVAAEQADDIVVIARKLRKLRLHYASTGRALRWCHTDISSGDPRLDRIGCAMVRACVHDGHDEPTAALACVNRRVDLLVPVAAHGTE